MSAHLNRFTISLPTDDRDRAMSFYRDVFELELVGEPEADGIPEPLQFRLGDGVLLALIPTGGLAGALGERDLASSGVSECVLGYAVDAGAEVDELVRRIRDAGGSVLTEAVSEDCGYTALCADPDGHAWQITAEAAPGTDVVAAVGGRDG